MCGKGIGYGRYGWYGSVQKKIVFYIMLYVFIFNMEKDILWFGYN